MLLDTEHFIEELTEEDLLKNDAVFHAFLQKEGASRTRFKHALEDRAKKLGCFKKYKEVFSAFLLEYVKKQKTEDSGVIEFTKMPQEAPLEPLSCGDWIANDEGVYKRILKNDEIKKEYACSHPIIPIQIYKNIENETEKVKLAYYKYGKWKYITCEMVTISSVTAIITLSAYGIRVTTNNAKDLVIYLDEVISLNQDVLPCVDSISRLGWLNEEFVPYCGTLYDGEKYYKEIFDSIHEKGNYDKWLKTAIEMRKNEFIKIAMATSFASPLISKLGILNFITHFHGTSGYGKSVSLIVAASIWANPQSGKFFRKLNMTKVAFGRLLSFLHHMPLIGDELQLLKEEFNNQYDSLVMFMGEGVDRTRGTTTGLQDTGTWSCTCVTAGEDQITKENSGGGTRNRVIEIHVENKMVHNGHEVCEVFKNNYGFAGKKFLDVLDTDVIQQRFKYYYSELMKGDATEKQVNSMAAILVADELATKYIFKDNNGLTINDVKKYLATNEEVNIGVRAWNWITGFIEVNKNRFTLDGNHGEVWGSIVENGAICRFVKTKLTEQMSKHGFEFDSVKKYWADHGWLKKDKYGKYRNRINCVDYIDLFLNQDENENKEIIECKEQISIRSPYD